MCKQLKQVGSACNIWTVSHNNQNHSVVVISTIQFSGRQNTKWEDVELYLKRFVGKEYSIAETSDTIYIGSDFPNELKGSDDTKRLVGANAKAKANATQVIPALIATASNKRWQKNYKSKHKIDAKHGWYRFTSRFALPVYLKNGEIDRYNIFRIELLIRHASDNNLYLYDMVNVKKETSTPLGQ